MLLFEESFLVKEKRGLLLTSQSADHVAFLQEAAKFYGCRLSVQKCDFKINGKSSSRVMKLIVFIKKSSNLMGVATIVEIL